MELIFEIIGWAMIAGFAVGVFCAVVMAVVITTAWLIGWKE